MTSTLRTRGGSSSRDIQNSQVRIDIFTTTCTGPQVQGRSTSFRTTCTGPQVQGRSATFGKSFGESFSSVSNP
jgi:hypothetical protein